MSLAFVVLLRRRENEFWQGANEFPSIDIDTCCEWMPVQVVYKVDHTNVCVCVWASKSVSGQRSSACYTRIFVSCSFRTNWYGMQIRYFCVIDANDLNSFLQIMLTLGNTRSGIRYGIRIAFHYPCSARHDSHSDCKSSLLALHRKYHKNFPFLVRLFVCSFAALWFTDIVIRWISIRNVRK